MKFLKFALPLTIWACITIVQSQSFSQTESRDFFNAASLVSKPAAQIKSAPKQALRTSDELQNQPVQIDPVQLRKLRLQNLFNAIRLVESGGNNQAVGDGGKALGPYQITRSYWLDATKQGNVNWDYGTFVWNTKYSEQIMLWYWRLHCPEALDEFYQTGYAEALTRVHNGGPTGQLKPQTLRYWHRVQALMD